MEKIGGAARNNTDEELGRNRKERWREREQAGEHDDLETRGSAHDQKFGICLEQREDWLADRVRPECDEMHEAQRIRREGEVLHRGRAA